jgi:CubicO group peptidase (beta-lactamase class C family)
MKRTALVWSLIVLIVLAGCQPIVAPTPEADTPAAEAAAPSAPQPQPADASTLYSDPEGRFTVPVPTNWNATTRDGYAWLTSPNDDIEVAVVVVPGEDMEAAVAQAWAMVDADFDAPVLEVTELPASGGVDRIISVDYETGEGNPIAAAVGLLANGNTYVLLVRGDLTAIAQRSSQLVIIQSGLRIAGIEQVDLSGVEPLPFDDAMAEEFAAYIESKLTQYGVPGASVAVVQDGEIVFIEGFGVREIGGDAPVTPETMMMIGSVGKTMTTMLMATVVDDGLMEWDTPAQEVLPEFAVADPQLSQEITVRNLVCACTGVPRRDLQLLFNADEMSAEDVVESLEQFQFFTAFGEAFQYSNQLVATGGYAAAAAAGAEWGNLFEGYVTELEARILAPIGMSSTTLSFEEVVATGNYGLPHAIGIETPYELIPLEMERVVLPVAPAGAHWSNAQDMARYLLTELALGVAPDGTRVVSEENLRVTWEPQVPVSAESSYGLGWFVDEYKGQLMIQHGGNTLGFSADLAFLPDAGFGIVVLANGRITNAFNEAVRYRLLEMLFEQPHEADSQADFTHQAIREMVVEPIAEAVPVEADAVASFLGSYRNAELGGLELEWVDDALYFDVGEFRMEVRALPAEEEADEANGTDEADGPGDVNYVIYDPPFAGTPVRFEMGEDGEPSVVFGAVVDEYTFTPTD